VTYETPETTALLTAEARRLLEMFARAIRLATPERTQAWEQKIERVLEDGRALADAAELGERVERQFLERPIRKLVLVRKPSTVACFLAAHGIEDEPGDAA
jgi:plasmid stabilization system protein ParE